MLNANQAKVIVSMPQLEMDNLISRSRLRPTKRSIFIGRMIRGPIRKGEAYSNVRLSPDERLATAIYLLDS